MDLFGTIVCIVVIVLVLLHDKGTLKVDRSYSFMNRKKEKERFRAFFYERYKHHYDDPAALEEACEESWKKERER